MVRAQNSSLLPKAQPDQEVNKLQRQKILIFIYPIYDHNWRNISIKRNILTTKKKIHRHVGRDKDLSVPPLQYSSPTFSTLSQQKDDDVG